MRSTTDGGRVAGAGAAVGAGVVALTGAGIAGTVVAGPRVSAAGDAAAGDAPGEGDVAGVCVGGTDACAGDDDDRKNGSAAGDADPNG